LNRVLRLRLELKEGLEWKPCTCVKEDNNDNNNDNNSNVKMPAAAAADLVNVKKEDGVCCKIILFRFIE